MTALTEHRIKDITILFRSEYLRGLFKEFFVKACDGTDYEERKTYCGLCESMLTIPVCETKTKKEAMKNLIFCLHE